MPKIFLLNVEKLCKNPVSALLCLSLSGCKILSDTLDTASSVLGSVNSVLSSSTSSLSSSSSISIDSHTQSSVTSAINKSSTNNDVRTMFNDAKPYIEKMVSTAACTRSGNIMQKFADAEAIGYVEPHININYHKSGCLNVLRINNIKKKSANAFSFNVQYISPQSEETVKRGYTAIKQNDGEWLFKWSEWG